MAKSLKTRVRSHVLASALSGTTNATVKAWLVSTAAFAGVLAALIFAASSPAWSGNTPVVTITFDDGEGLTGELLENRKDSLRIATIMGEVTIPKAGVSCIGSACPEDIRVDDVAAPVTLTARDGSFKLSGDLIAIANNQYVLSSEIGEVRTDLAKVICEGSACPDTAPSKVTFGGPVTFAYKETVIEGTLKGLDEDAYLVYAEAWGNVRVPRSVTCEGAGCPN